MNVPEALDQMEAILQDMKPTHQLRTRDHTDVTAWQFLPTAGVPVWVMRNFHDLHGGWTELQHANGTIARHGDWIVACEGIAFVLHAEEFEKCFMPLPQKTL